MGVTTGQGRSGRGAKGGGVGSPPPPQLQPVSTPLLRSAAKCLTSSVVKVVNCTWLRLLVGEWSWWAWLPAGAGGANSVGSTPFCCCFCCCCELLLRLRPSVAVRSGAASAAEDDDASGERRWGGGAAAPLEGAPRWLPSHTHSCLWSLVGGVSLLGGVT